MMGGGLFLEFWPDGKSLALMGGHGSLRIPSNGDPPVKSFGARPARSFAGASFSNDGQFMAFHCDDELAVLSLAEGKLTRSIQPFQGRFAASDRLLTIGVEPGGASIRRADWRPLKRIR